MFGMKKKEYLIAFAKGNEAVESVSKTVNFSESVEPSSRNSDPNMTQNEHVYAIYCRSEVDGDVISGENVKTTEGYVLLKFEVASSNSFRENKNQPFA